MWLLVACFDFGYPKLFQNIVFGICSDALRLLVELTIKVSKEADSSVETDAQVFHCGFEGNLASPSVVPIRYAAISAALWLFRGVERTLKGPLGGLSLAVSKMARAFPKVIMTTVMCTGHSTAMGKLERRHVCFTMVVGYQTAK